MDDKFNVTWETFSDHIQLMFKELYEEEKHSDVTLICDDRTQFKAHKIILSACSQVLKEIIEINPTQDSLIYLRGIQSNELESILQFMYLGEAKCPNDRISEFLKVAQDLEVKEFYKGLKTENVKDVTKRTVTNDQTSDENFVNVKTDHFEEEKQIECETTEEKEPLKIEPEVTAMFKTMLTLQMFQLNSNNLIVDPISITSIS